MTEINIKKEERRLRSLLENSKSVKLKQDENLEFVEGHAFQPYEGFYKYGKRHGLGIESLRDSESYVGRWDNGEFVYGVFNEKNGDSYCGQWEKGSRHGYGRQEWNDGTIYEGVWKYNYKHGTGVMIYPYGHELSGLWSFDLPKNVTWTHPCGKKIELEDYMIDGSIMPFLPTHNEYHVVDHDRLSGVYIHSSWINGFTYGRNDIGYINIPCKSNYEVVRPDDSEPYIFIPHYPEEKEFVSPLILVPNEVNSFDPTPIIERVKRLTPSRVELQNQLVQCNQEYFVWKYGSVEVYYFLNQLEVYIIPPKFRTKNN